MRRGVIFTIMALVAVACAAYFYFAGREYVFRFTEPQLQQALSERLPIEKSYLIILVTLDHPRVKLVEGSDRVNAGLDVTLNIRLGDEPLPLGGSIDASGRLHYDPQGGRFFLTDPIIEQLHVQGIPQQHASRVANVLGQALGEYFADRPIYTLDRRDAKQLIASMVLKSVVVENQQLVVTLGLDP